MGRGARDPRQPVTTKWDPTTLLLSFIGSDDDLPIAGFSTDVNSTYVRNSIIDAKGDIIVGLSSDTTSRKAVGSDGDALLVDSSQSDGLVYSQVAQPNLVLNSDFGRRTVFGLAMPEVFADTSGYLVESGTPTVGSNILTQNAANNRMVYPKSHPGTFWRDGRASATFKAVSTTGVYELFFRYVNITNLVEAYMDGAGNFALAKVIAGTPTVVATVAQALTLNNWYWIELEAQGTTFIAKLYNTGGTTPGVTKASSTLLQTLTGTIADAAVVTGDMGIQSNQSTAQWGGIATGNGGVYVETWLPESWTITFAGTLGGQAIGIDEATDNGPLARDGALVGYIPATSRRIDAQFDSGLGTVDPSTKYAGSFYVKHTSVSGSLITYTVQTKNNALGGASTLYSVGGGTDTSWVRLTSGQVNTTASSARRISVFIQWNVNTNQTGTSRVMLPQFEKGGVVTAWRNAPEDGPVMSLVGNTPPATDITTTSASFVEVDPRDLSVNMFCPNDCILDIQYDLTTLNSGANANSFQILVDGVGGGSAEAMVTSTTAISLAIRRSFKVAAGKHRISLTWKVAAGTGTINASLINPRLRVLATRGK